MDATHLLQLGSPHGPEPAAFTRFVLPFAYQRTQTIREEGPFYEVATGADWIHSAHSRSSGISSDLERSRYLTPETRRVLYDRAQWFVLRGQPKQPMEIDGKQVEIHAPAIILFEYEQASPRPLLQTGLLVIEVWFAQSTDEQPSISHQALLNELFRYWRIPFDRHSEKSTPFGLTNRDVLAKLGRSNFTDPYFDPWAEWLSYPIQVGQQHFNLFPVDWADAARRYVNGACSNTPCESNHGWVVQPDNRAYVWTCCIHSVSNSNNQPGSPSQPWGSFLNVDQLWPNSGPPTAFEQDWTDQRTYTRWAHTGALYGYSSHSGAMLSPPCSEPPTWQHFREIYFDQALLLLYLQTTIFRFSERLTELSAKALQQSSREGPPSSFLKDFNALRWDFALFTNLYRFPIISNQQQALEMYVLQRSQLDVEDLYLEVEKEIHSTQGYLDSFKRGCQADQAQRLTTVATVGLIISLTISMISLLFGESIRETLGIGKTDAWLLFFAVLLTLGVFCEIMFTTYRFSPKDSHD